MMKVAYVVTLCCVGWVSKPGNALAGQPVVIRGPYLQLGTPRSITVRWRTDLSVEGRVRYGLSPVDLTHEERSATPTVEHEVHLGNLEPATKYYYAIGTSAVDLQGGDESHFFVTSPEVGTVVSTRIWVLGDSGTANARARSMRDAYYAFTGDTHTDLWLMLGDNAYPVGADEEYQRAVFDMFPQMLRKSVLWPTLGNHDGYSANSQRQEGPYYDIFSLPTKAESGGVASGTEAYYSFDYGNIHFICLESFEMDRSTDSPMLTWLAVDLAATTQQWIIAYWHHPPYSKASHDSDREIELIEMRENALPILEDGGVDLVLCGHSHAYERTYLLSGHYGPSYTLRKEMILDCGDGRSDGHGAYEKPVVRRVEEGAVYIEAGNSGGQGFSRYALDHPSMVWNSEDVGSLVIDVDGSRLDVRYLSSQEEVVDYFSIVKEGLTREPMTCSPVAEVPFRRGDVNGDGKINLSDPIWIVSALFFGASFGPCRAAADVDDDGKLVLTDAIYTLNFLFRGGPAPPAPYPGCGEDPTDGDPACTEPWHCRP